MFFWGGGGGSFQFLQNTFPMKGPGAIVALLHYINLTVQQFREVNIIFETTALTCTSVLVMMLGIQKRSTQSSGGNIHTC